MTGPTPQSEHVRELLEELHETLQAPGTLDAELEGSLRTALAEVQEALERRHESAPETGEGSLAARIEGLALEFETAHPTLAGLINRLTHQLASLGV